MQAPLTNSEDQVMFDKMTEQFQNSFKPVSELVAINAAAMEKLANQQTALFTGVLNDSVAYAEGLANQQDISAVVEAQKSFAEGVQEKVVCAAKDAYEVMAETQEKAGELLKGAYTQAQEVATAVAPKAAKASKAAK